MVASVNMPGRWKACKGLRLIWEGSVNMGLWAELALNRLNLPIGSLVVFRR